MILLINVCKEKLHYEEFVRPIVDILREKGIEVLVRNYLDLIEDDLKNCENVIICGTSLKDNEFIDDFDRFMWLKEFNKPVLGICAGMQIIGLTYGGKIKSKKEIGFYKEKFNKNFLGLKGTKEVFHLHNNYVDFTKLNEFEIYCKTGGVIQAVKHKKKEIYGVLFHPEVRNKEMILEFVASSKTRGEK